MVKKLVLLLFFAIPVFAFWGKPLYIHSNTIESIQNIGEYIQLGGKLVKVKPNLIEVVKIIPDTGDLSYQTNVVVPIAVPNQYVGLGSYLKVCADPDCKIILNFTYCDAFQCSDKPFYFDVQHYPIAYIKMFANVSSINIGKALQELGLTYDGYVIPFTIAFHPSGVLFYDIALREPITAPYFYLAHDDSAFVCLNNNISNCFIVHPDQYVTHGTVYDYVWQGTAGAAIIPNIVSKIYSFLVGVFNVGGPGPVISIDTDTTHIQTLTLWQIIFVKLPKIYNNTPIYIYVYKSQKNYGKPPSKIFVYYMKPSDFVNTTTIVSSFYGVDVTAAKIVGNNWNSTYLPHITISTSDGPVYITYSTVAVVGGLNAMVSNFKISNSTGTFPLSVSYYGTGHDIHINGNDVFHSTTGYDTAEVTTYLVKISKDGIWAIPLGGGCISALVLLYSKILYMLLPTNYIMSYKTQINSVEPLSLAMPHTNYIYSSFAFIGPYSWKEQYMYIKYG